MMADFSFQQSHRRSWRWLLCNCKDSIKMIQDWWGLALIRASPDKIYFGCVHLKTVLWPIFSCVCCCLWLFFQFSTQGEQFSFLYGWGKGLSQSPIHRSNIACENCWIVKHNLSQYSFAHFLLSPDTCFCWSSMHSRCSERGCLLSVRELFSLQKL